MHGPFHLILQVFGRVEMKKTDSIGSGGSNVMVARRRWAAEPASHLLILLGEGWRQQSQCLFLFVRFFISFTTVARTVQLLISSSVRAGDLITNNFLFTNHGCN